MKKPWLTKENDAKLKAMFPNGYDENNEHDEWVENNPDGFGTPTESQWDIFDDSLLPRVSIPTETTGEYD